MFVRCPGTAVVVVEVIPVNEATPVFTVPPSVIVDEDAAVGTLVVDVSSFLALQLKATVVNFRD